MSLLPEKPEHTLIIPRVFNEMVKSLAKQIPGAKITTGGFFSQELSIHCGSMETKKRVEALLNQNGISASWEHSTSKRTL